MLKRSGFNKSYQSREKKFPKPDPSAFRNPVAVTGDVSSDAKPVAHRNATLLEMARGRECLACTLSGVSICQHDSVVAAHSNWLIHGKAKGRKADDFWSVWLGFEHHSWLDQGSADMQVKREMFDSCHKLQIDRWREVVHSTSEPDRFRKAAQWALDHLKDKKWQ